MCRLKLFIITFVLFPVFLGAQNDRFYSTIEGLSSISIHGFFQDSKGFLWIPTDFGLNKFNGYSFKIYLNQADDSTSISSNTCYVVFEDSGGNLWVGTNMGLNRYDNRSDCFTRIHFTLKNEEIALNVKSVIEDKQKKLWLITSHGLIRFDPLSGKYDFYNHQFRNDGTPAYSKYNQAIIDSKGNLWIGTDDNGVLIFDTQKAKFFNIREYTGINYQFPDRTVLVVHQNKSGQLFFGTQKAGIISFDIKTGTFQKTGYSTDPSNLLDGGIYSITSDKRGVIWIGTEHNGLKIYDPKLNKLTDSNLMIDIPNVKKSKFHCYEDKLGDLWFGIQYRGIYHKISSNQPFHSIGNSSKKVQELSHFVVKSILRDSKDNLWVGTDGGGLNVKWKGSKEFIVFKSTGQKINDKAIISLHEDHRGWIWIGTYLEGLYCYKGQHNELINYKIPDSDNYKRKNYIYDLVEDSNGNLWIGTNGGGLYYFDVSKESFTDCTQPSVNGKSETLNPFINALSYDKDSTLWIGTYGGIYGWNKKKDFFHSYQMSSGDIANNVIFSVSKDNEENIWFGTLSGLYCYRSKIKTLESYTTDNGLCDNSVMAVEIDNSGNLWISTSGGISKLNSKTGAFQNYYFYDGLPCNEYRPGASFKDNDGMIYFGGTDGFVYFNPDSINNNPVKPNLIFTNFKIFNQEIKYNQKEPNGILQKDINETDTIILNHTHQSFTIEFAAINFSVPEKIKYAVQLEGFNSNWDYKNYKQRYATYTNLNPGTYFLNVKSTDLNGQWNEQVRRICIIVKPPFWLSWWALIIYTSILFLAIYYFRKIAVFRIRMKNQLYLEHIEREKLEEINHSKMQFFTNISHEIRTPLTLITAPVEKLLESPLNSAQKKLADYIYRNTKRLERIVNQLLELQKIENTQFRMKARETDLVTFLKEIVSLFDEKANEKNIHLAFECGYNKLMAWIDPEKIDKVIFNLLSNAFKFTPSGGLITVSLSKLNENTSEGNFVMSVSDSGKGMDKIHFERIFERFYQIENKETGQITGTGIGLHLSKELVEKHHGTISVTSKEGSGSTFTVIMPLGNKHFTPNEMYSEKPLITNYIHDNQSEISDSEPVTEDPEPEEFADSGKTLILLVEDDVDILNYLEDELSGQYQIIRANNGNDGWKLAFDRIPDLIVSDIMMPGTDGLELCRKVKSTIETSHIPVILLTAKTTVEHEIEGLETGADEYIHKPFHPKLLKLKVDKIIETRETLKQHFAKNTSFIPKEMNVTSADEKFLQKAIIFVKDNLPDTEMNIEKMGIALSISRVHLYRKLKAITNQNPTEFIRTIRLKQAAYLLSQNKLNISEIAYMVGFNSHQYFTNSFQKHFGMSPTEYSRREEQYK